MIDADDPRGPLPGFDRRAPRIDRIETIALRAPLGRRFSGSAYGMDNRMHIVTRLATRHGVVPEVYIGDTEGAAVS